MAGFYNNMYRGTPVDNSKQRQGGEGVTLRFIQTEQDLFLSYIIMCLLYPVSRAPPPSFDRCPEGGVFTARPDFQDIRCL